LSARNINRMLFIKLVLSIDTNSRQLSFINLSVGTMSESKSVVMVLLVL